MRGIEGLPKTLTPKHIEFLYANLSSLPGKDKVELLAMLDELERRKVVAKARADLLAFIKHIEPTYKVGEHHKILAGILEAMSKGEKDRAIINMPPRFGKSHMVSYYFPAWYLGNYPDKQVMMISNTASLAEGFGRKIRNLLDSDPYKEVFGGGKDGIELSQDSKSAGRWHTNRGGSFYAVGTGGAVAGRGADLLLCDDPHSEQDLIRGTGYAAFEQTYQWFMSGARTRLQPGAACAIVQTRWAESDLSGRLLKDMAMSSEADQYELVEFPAIIEREGEVEEEDPDNPSTMIKVVRGVPHSLWPEQWPVEDLLRTKASMPAFQWNAQYMQSPSGKGGNIIKRAWWKIWEEEHPPKVEFIIQAWDTAFEKHTRADFSACTTWGVWFNEKDNEGRGMANIILLNAFKDRLEFPELKRVAKKHYDEWNPDSLIIEKRASGAPLIYELRAMGLPVQEYTPGRGQDKIVRLNSVADLFSSGKVWAPQTRWAEEVIEEIAAFPAGEHDDLTDSTVLGLMRYRSGGFVRTDADEAEPVKYFKSSRRTGYY